MEVNHGRWGRGNGTRWRHLRYENGQNNIGKVRKEEVMNRIKDRKYTEEMETG